MARLGHGGLEFKYVGTTNEAVWEYDGGSVETASTAVVRSGVASLLASSETGIAFSCREPWVIGRNYYQRVYVYTPAAQASSDRELFSLYDQLASLKGIEITRYRNSGGGDATKYGHMQIRTQASGRATLAWSSSVMPVDTWQRIEVRSKPLTTTTIEVEVRLYPVTDLPTDAGEVVYNGVCAFDITRFPESPSLFNPGGFSHFDDWAVNDDTVRAGETAGTVGAFDSWCGPGKVYLLNPIADVAAADYTTPVWSTLDNRPPSTTKESLIDNPAEYICRFQSLDDAGVPDLPVGSTIPVFWYQVGSGGSNGLHAQIRGTSPAGLGAAKDNLMTSNNNGIRGAEPSHMPYLGRAVQPEAGIVGLSIGANPLELTVAGVYVDVGTQYVPSGGPRMVV